MKHLLFTTLMILILSSIGFSQLISFINESKIDKEILSTEGYRNNGILKFGTGVIIEYGILSTSSYKTDRTEIWIGIVTGTVLEFWGAYEWWDAATTLIVLKELKKYNISFQPTIIKNSYGVVPGIALRITF
jgi:hypothetical protein